MLPQAATDFYALQQRVNTTAAREAARAWRQMGDDLDASWSRVAPTVLSTLVEAQSQMATAADSYVPALLAETDLKDHPRAEFVPDSLVGVASDGRSVESLAYGAVTTTKEAIGGGATVQRGLEQGGNWLDLMMKLQVADAARTSVGVLTAVRTNLSGTVRVLNPPSCQRCAILAGRFYRWTQGFARHPRCDCVNQPVSSREYAQAEGFITDPMDAYRAGEIRDLTAAQKKAIEDGADIGEVVNAYRGISTTSTETAKSIRMRLRAENAPPRAAVPAGQPDLLGFLKPRPAPEPLVIPTPEGIYANSTSREDAIKQLLEWGYIK